MPLKTDRRSTHQPSMNIDGLPVEVQKLIFKHWLKRATLDDKRLCCHVGPGRLEVPQKLKVALQKVPQRLHRSQNVCLVELPHLYITRCFGTQTWQGEDPNYAFADFTWWSVQNRTGTLQLETVEGETAKCRWYIVMFIVSGMRDRADWSRGPYSRRFRLRPGGKAPPEARPGRSQLTYSPFASLMKSGLSRMEFFKLPGTLCRAVRQLLSTQLYGVHSR